MDVSQGEGWDKQYEDLQTREDGTSIAPYSPTA